MGTFHLGFSLEPPVPMFWLSIKQAPYVSFAFVNCSKHSTMNNLTPQCVLSNTLFVISNIVFAN